MMNSEEFSPEPQTSLSSAHPVLAEKGERRQLTIMFCDLVNSVGLSGRLDPEDWQDLIAAYWRRCDSVVSKHKGLILDYIGDGLLICFGYPVANEDDAKQAIHAGLALIDAVLRLNEELDQAPGLTLKVRIGIATGLVVIGNVIASGTAGREAVFGEAINLASRLQGVANPNRVTVSAITRQLAAENFVYRDLGPQTLKVSMFQCPFTRSSARGR